MGCRLIADSAAARTLFAPLARERREVAAFAYLDPEWRLLGLRQTRGGDTAIVFRPEKAWKLPRRGEQGNLEGVAARFLGVRVLDARTGKEIATRTL